MAVIGIPRQGPGRRGSGTNKERRKYPVRHYQVENEKDQLATFYPGFIIYYISF